MTVKFENAAEDSLLRKLSSQALVDILHIEEEHVNFGFAKETLSTVVIDLSLVCHNQIPVFCKVLLGSGDALGQLKDLKTEGLDGDDLVGVYVNLL